MVKKKGKSKRVALKDKYKMQKRVVETNRKRRKQTKRDAKAGIVRHDAKKKKDPGIPNSWPFKQNLLNEIQRTRERAKQQQAETKQRKANQLALLRQHQEGGGTARTVQELMDQAQRDGQEFDSKANQKKEEKSNSISGQSSRRAYLRELKNVVDSADVLLQVLDARDPISSRIHKSVEDAVLAHADKRMVLVLNKIDLVPKTVVGQWLTVLRKSHPTIAIKASNDKTNSSSGTSVNEDSAIPVGMEGLLQLLKNYARTGATGNNKKNNKSTIVVGMIGYPNVGKSSIINALKRCRAVGVSPTPGFTTCLQEVVLDRHVRLLDSPGVVFDDSSTLLGNCVNANTMDDPITPVAALVQRCHPTSLVMTYNIPAFPPKDTMMFLALVARSLGRVQKGGIPDKVAAARTVLRDWNSGKIPYFTPPPLLRSESSPTTTTSHSDAVLVSEFSQEFDLSKFDNEIMQSLEDTDEMDYVQLSENNNKNGGEEQKSFHEAVAVLSGQEVDDEEMEDAGALDSKRDELADAEDYDFEDM